MWNIFRDAKAKLAELKRPERKRDRVLVIGICALLLGTVVVPILMFWLPTPWYWDLTIIFGTPLLLGVGWYGLGRIDPEEETEEPLKVIRDAMDKYQEETLPLDLGEDAQPHQREPNTVQRETTVWRKRRKPAAKVKITKDLRETLKTDEEPEYTHLLHYLKLTPSVVVVLSALAGLAFVHVVPNTMWYLSVIMIIASAALVGLPIYRRVREVVGRIRPMHIIGAIAFLTVIGVLLFYYHYLDNVARAIVNSVLWILRVLNLDSWTFTTAMLAIVWIAILELLIEFAEWRTNPIVVTNQRLIFSSGLIAPRYASAMLVKLTEETVRRYRLLPIVGPTLPFVSLRVEAPNNDPTEGVEKVNWVPAKLLNRIHTGAPKASN